MQQSSCECEILPCEISVEHNKQIIILVTVITLIIFMHVYLKKALSNVCYAYFNANLPKTFSLHSLLIAY